MLRKILFGALTLLLTFCLTGCGDEKKDDAAKKDEAAAPKAEEKVETSKGSPDKAVLAYAQLYSYGVIEDENMAAAGMTDKDVETVQNQIFTSLVDSFKEYPLNDESIAKMTEQYVAKLHRDMNIKATVKKEDANNPVVELTVRTIDQASAKKIAENNADLAALNTAYDELKAQGLTDAELKENAEFQEFALKSINKYINEFPLDPETSMDVTCQMVQGSDGKVYWAPEDPTAVAKFVTAQK